MAIWPDHLLSNTLEKDTKAAKKPKKRGLFSRLFERGEKKYVEDDSHSMVMSGSV